MQKARRHPKRGSDRLRAHGFRYSFTPLLGVLFTFPSRYWCAIGLLGVFSLAGWSRPLRAGFLVPRPTQALRHGWAQLRLWASHPLRGGVPAAPARGPSRLRGAYYPARAETRAVWAAPLSLAATRGIAFAFSSRGY